MRRLFLVCGLGYILIYAFEGVVRYGLVEAGASNAIFIRDAMLLLPCAALFVSQAMRLRVHPAFFVFAAVIAVHGALMMANLRSAEAVVYGAKLLDGELFGFLVGGMLAVPDRRTRRILGLVLFASLVGIVLDKWVLTYPWEGMSTHIGGITVAVSKDWDTGNGMAKRVAGFTRISIAAAVLVPVLTLVLMPAVRSWLVRLGMFVACVAAVFFTTQKGALIAFLPAGLVFFLPRRWRFPLLGVVCVGFALLDIALPIVTGGMVVSDAGGVFSLASFAMRIMMTWPQAWQWIHLHQIFPLGVGLGGLGGAMRLYAFDMTQSGDNMFLLLYAWFGVMGFVYLGWVLVTVWRTPKEAREQLVGAAAVLTFVIGYGAVITVLEDPLAALFVGASVGAMWQARQKAIGSVWAETFAPKAADPYAEPALPAALPTGGRA